MSVWSYVFGVMEVETFARSDAEAMYLVQTVVNHLPKIHGSEGCVKYYLSKPEGYTSSSNADEFGAFSNLMRGENHFGDFHVQTRVLVTVMGDLRDTKFMDAVKDTTKMLARFSSRLWIPRCLISVESNGRQFIFNDPAWIRDMDRNNWARGLLWEWED